MSKWWLMSDEDKKEIEERLMGLMGMDAIDDYARAWARRIIRLRLRETDAIPADCLEYGGDGKAVQADLAICPLCGGSGKKRT